MPFWYLFLWFGVVAQLYRPAAGVLSLAPGAPPMINAEGARGDLLSIEAASDLNSGWDLLGSIVLTNSSFEWPDLWAGSSPNRFYRITRGPAGDAPFAENFRLTDHLGKSRELFYYWGAEEINAFVLMFTANGCEKVEEQLPAIQALRQKFESKGVVFWMIDSNPADTRAAIAAEAKRLGISFPIMQDRAQTVARLYHSSTASEVVCVDRANLSIFYRGAIDNRAADGLNDGAAYGSAAPTRNYLDEALTAFLAGESYNIRATKAPGCEVPVQNAPTLSYSKEIAPILQAKCVTCHVPGNIAPWAMTNYAIVQQYAGKMIEQISSREMPPWHADPEYGQFKNDISLTPAEETKLIQWLTAGAPRGEGPDPLINIPAPAPKWPVELGEPDLIIRAPEQQVMANGIEPYRYIFVDTGLKTDVWLRAAIVKPSNPKVVHHYLVWEGASATQLAVGLAGYVPGTDRGVFPEGSGVVLHADSQVTFNLHYTPDGENATDQPELALWFYKTPPKKELITLPLVNLNFTIPAGARDYPVSAKIPFVESLPYAGTLYALTAHMHLRGSHMQFEVIYPDNTRETLLSVPHYEFHWQTTYQLAQPKKIPAGSKLLVTGGFDNSNLNIENPDPTKPVRWGEQSFEEMFIGYFDFTQD